MIYYHHHHHQHNRRDKNNQASVSFKISPVFFMGVFSLFLFCFVFVLVLFLFFLCVVDSTHMFNIDTSSITVSLGFSCT